MQIKKLGSILAAIVLFIASPAIGSGDVVSMGIIPYFDPGTEIQNAVALRYKVRVNQSQNNDPSFKILFGFKRFYTPGNPDTYILETNLYTYWVGYNDTGCQLWPGPFTTNRHANGQSGLWLSVPDYHSAHNNKAKRGRVGVRPANDATLQMFPRVGINIDGVGGQIQDPNNLLAGLAKIETISQMDITGKDIEITYTRGGTFSSPLSGWGGRYKYKDIDNKTVGIECGPDLPPDTYRIWIAEARIDKARYKWEFALPDESARYFYPSEISSFVTEFFGNNPELFQIYLWDLNVQREDSTSWEALSRWRVYRASDPPIVNRTHGTKLSTYKRKQVIEISNDGTDTYYKEGDIFEIKAMKTLKVKVKDGNGTVSSPDGLNCSRKCEKNYPFGSSVTLTAQPLPGYVFKKWSGDCVGTSMNCSIFMDAKKKSVTAKFKKSR